MSKRKRTPSLMQLIAWAEEYPDVANVQQMKRYGWKPGDQMGVLRELVAKEYGISVQDVNNFIEHSCMGLCCPWFSEAHDKFMEGQSEKGNDDNGTGSIG
jgi:hypothetical protein